MRWVQDSAETALQFLLAVAKWADSKKDTRSWC